MKGSLRYRLFFLTLVLLLGLCLLNPLLFRTYLFDPLTRIAWLVIRTFLMIDQYVYWVLLIFAVFTLILRVLPARRESLLRPVYADTTQLEDRVAYWEELLRSAEDNADAQTALRHALADLHQSIQALAEEGAPPVIELPPIPSADNHRSRAIMRAARLFQPVRKSDGDRNSELQKRVAYILKSLETQMEIPHDR